MTESGSQAAVSSQKLRRTGTKSSTARLSLTTKISGRAAARWKSTSSKAFAVGVRPDTPIRPVPSLRWEATRVKAGSFSTSAKSSRTKGRSMQDDFSRSPNKKFDLKLCKTKPLKSGVVVLYYEKSGG